MTKKPSSKNQHLFTSRLERSTNKLWGCHFQVPSTIAKSLIDSKLRRVVCTLNNSATYQCAILHYGKGLPVISVNKKLRDSLGLSFGSEVHVVLKKDESEYGLPLPDELRELFEQDAEGDRLFHALTRGKQRTLLYIVDKPKNQEQRVIRALAVVKHLKLNKGKIDYKQLGAMIKDPRLKLRTT